MSETDDVNLRARARVGTVLRGKWHLDRIVGIGGTACVYAATHRNRSRVAIKMLHAEFSANRSIVSRFLREGYVGNAVVHPGTVQVVDDDVTEDGHPYLVMELLDGETLGDRVDRMGRLQPFEVAAVGIQLLDVLAAAHAQNIVHRDLKPDNVFLTRAGQLKVLDFGIARLREAAMESSTGTLQGSLLGTPGFMAPEQALGRWNEVDGRTDIWAVGATLFTVLTGRFAHEADSVQEQLVMAATRHATRIADASPDTPAWLADIVDRAMAFDPAARFPDARSMKEALEAACIGVDMPPLSVPEKPISLVRTPLFPDSEPRLSRDGQTIAGIQTVAQDGPPSQARPRRTLWLAAASVLAVFGIAFAISSATGTATGTADGSQDPVAPTVTSPAGASITAPRTDTPKTSPEKPVDPPPRNTPLAEPEKTAAPPSVTPVAPVASSARAPEARKKPPPTQLKPTSKKPEPGEGKPAAADNPFDSRH